MRFLKSFLRISHAELEQHKIIDNNEIILPPVSFITTVDTKMLTCDKGIGAYTLTDVFFLFFIFVASGRVLSSRI